MKKKSKSDTKRRDTMMASANDKDGSNAADATPASAVVDGVMTDIKKKAEKVKKLPSIVHTTERRIINAKYRFSKDELDGVAKRLTDRLCDLAQIEDEKKSVMANYTDKIKAGKLEISKLSRHHRDGYELREHECFVVYDYKKKEKRFKDVNTKKVIEVQSFGPGDEQRRMAI